MLSVAFSKSSPCNDCSASRASGVKYVFSMVSKYSSCKRTEKCYYLSRGWLMLQRSRRSISVACYTVHQPSKKQKKGEKKVLSKFTSSMIWQKPFASNDLRSLVLFSWKTLRKVSIKPSTSIPSVFSSRGLAPAKTCM